MIIIIKLHIMMLFPVTIHDQLLPKLDIDIHRAHKQIMVFVELVILPAEKLIALYGLPSSVRVVQSRGLYWVGQMAQMYKV
jgi:hypothetical protein